MVVLSESVHVIYLVRSVVPVIWTGHYALKIHI